MYSEKSYFLSIQLCFHLLLITASVLGTSSTLYTFFFHLGFFSLNIFGELYLSFHRNLLDFFFLKDLHTAPLCGCTHCLFNHSPKYWHSDSFQQFSLSRNHNFKSIIFCILQVYLQNNFLEVDFWANR